jgi:hypothetical protein
MTLTAEPIQDNFSQELDVCDSLYLKAAFENLQPSKNKADRFNRRLRQAFEYLVERHRLYEILKIERRPGAVRLTLANLWRLTRLEGQPGLLLHTFDLAEGCWREQDPEAITWRKLEHGLRRPKGAETVWPDLETSFQEKPAGSDLFKNIMVAWLEKVRPVLSDGIKPSLPPGEEERFAAFIFHRLVNLPSILSAGVIDNAIKCRIWCREFPLFSQDIQSSLSRHLAAQSADLARLSREAPNCLPLLNFIPPAWWSRRDLLQDKVLRAAGPFFKSISPAGLRWLRRAPAEILDNFHRYFKGFPLYSFEEDRLSIAREVVEVMAGLPPQEADRPDFAETVFELSWHLLTGLREINPQPDQTLRHSLASLQVSHVMATWAAGKQFSTDDIDEVLDWFIDEGRPQGLPDKNSNWLSLMRRSDKWHREVWQREQAEEANTVWTSLLGETVIDGIKITPLTSGLDLFNEGREMRHCVSSYTQRCLNLGYRIFSLDEADGTRSTLSLRPQNDGYTIEQHAGPGNGPVSPAAARAALKICRLYTRKHLKEAEPARTA